MPLPWLGVFLMIFLAIFTIYSMVSSNYVKFSVNKKFLNVKMISMPW